MDMDNVDCYAAWLEAANRAIDLVCEPYRSNLRVWFKGQERMLEDNTPAIRYTASLIAKSISCFGQGSRKSRDEKAKLIYRQLTSHIGGNGHEPA